MWDFCDSRTLAMLYSGVIGAMTSPRFPQRRIPGEGTRDYRDADIRRGRIRMRRALGAFACLDVVADVLALDHEDAILGDVGGVVADALEVACNQD